MPQIVWDKVEDRVYETGLDRGVLYLPDGSAVPWNGLTSIIESFNKETSPVYFDGMKISDLVVLGDFAASMKAVTYPDEFVELEGMGSPKSGIWYADQKPQTFGLCYRTQIGNAAEGDVAGYKLHILYNVTAMPKEKTYASISGDPSLVEFEWDIAAVPEEVPGFLPTAHVVIDSRDVDPWLLEDLEDMLYGGTFSLAALIPMPVLAQYILDWYRIKITDNGDGTWTAESQRDGLINVDSTGYFEILQANAIFLDAVTYVLSNTVDLSDVPQLKITDNGNGTWSATTSSDALFVYLPSGEVQILNADVVFVDAETFQISDTVE